MRWQPLDSLDPVLGAAVVAAAVPRRFAKDEIAVHAGEHSDSVHLVVGGHFAVRVATPDGDTATLDVIGAGSWFGELAMMSSAPDPSRSATVISLDPAETLVLSEVRFRGLVAEHPRIERLVVQLMADRLRDLNARLLRTMYMSLEGRLCACLVDLAAIYPATGGRTVIPLTQEHLAGLVGGTRPSVNQALRALVAEGLIELGRGRVVLLEPGALEARCAL